MQKPVLPLAITAITLFTLISWNCTKLDTTDIGSDLLPAVDNVNTFDTILDINSTQGFFNDSLSFIGKYDDYTVGSINNDPLFGTTTASIFMQLKPPFYPYFFGNTGDTIVGLDSIVLCLRYRGFWGDSLLPVHLDVREVSSTSIRFRDSTDKDNPTNYSPGVMGASIGFSNIDVRTMADTIRLNNGRDRVINQIRIKLSQAWAQQLFGRDSILANAATNAFYSDSAYRRLYNGIAVIGGGGGNGLIYASLSDTATKLEIHYKKKTSGTGKLDSVYTSFRLNPVLGLGPANAPVSSTSDYIVRNRSGFPAGNPATGDHYIQTSPGTYINLKIPGLAGLSNSIVHRAEVIIEQIPTNTMIDERFSGPNFLYLDLIDTITTKAYWKPIYLDLNTAEAYDPDFRTSLPYIPSNFDFQYYGGYRRNKPDGFGNQIKHYNFNVSRYVQQILTDRTHSYDMRVYAPFKIRYPQYSINFINYGNNIAFGRIRVGSGSNPNYKLRMRIIYSKIR